MESGHWEVERISKLAAAQRQIATAIRLFFEDKDIVSVYTLAHAAQTVLYDLLKRTGDTSSLRIPPSWFSSEDQKQYIATMNMVPNFFKHADRDDPEELLEFDPEVVNFVLVDCVEMHLAHVGRHRPEGIVFGLWFRVWYPLRYARAPLLKSLMADEVVDRIRRKHPEIGMRGASKAPFLQLLDEISAWPHLFEGTQ